MPKPIRLTQDMIEQYIAQGYWDGTSIAGILERNSASYPDDEAVVDSSQRYTWSQLNQSAKAVAQGLMDMGIKRDQALVAQLPTSAATLILLLACQQAGILSCFPPMTFRHKELAHLLKRLDAAAVVTPAVKAMV